MPPTRITDIEGLGLVVLNDLKIRPSDAKFVQSIQVGSESSAQLLRIIEMSTFEIDERQRPTVESTKKEGIYLLVYPLGVSSGAVPQLTSVITTELVVRLERKGFYARNGAALALSSEPDLH